MTITDLSTEIERLEEKAEAAREDGNRAVLDRTLCAIDELADEMGVQPHEFGGGYE